jgi:hypothetical protein
VKDVDPLSVYVALFGTVVAGILAWTLNGLTEALHEERGTSMGLIENHERRLSHMEGRHEGFYYGTGSNHHPDDPNELRGQRDRVQ